MERKRGFEDAARVRKKNRARCLKHHKNLICSVSCAMCMYIDPSSMWLRTCYGTAGWLSKNINTDERSFLLPDAACSNSVREMVMVLSGQS